MQIWRRWKTIFTSCHSKATHSINYSNMSSLDSNMSTVQNRYRAALLGVLIGDCCGAPFECRRFENDELLQQIQSFFKPAQNPLTYTDDTSMTISTCKFLINDKNLDFRNLAKEYSEAYFLQPRRGYGPAVRQVFKILKDTKYQDPFGPAANQFDGSGSFGNGAAMRCNGIALYSHKKGLTNDKMLELTENCSRITHSHIYGIHGAQLLVTAIRYVLSLEDDTLDETTFIDHLINRMGELERSDHDVYTSKLQSIKKVLANLAVSGADVSQREIVELLGNDVSAQNSVPLAIYSFIRGISKFTDSYRLENEFIRTLHWAISCGGDTDTIASMACGLSGAYLGMSKIPENLYKNCESWKEMITLADQLALLDV